MTQILQKDVGTRTIPESDRFGPQLTHFSSCVLEDREPDPSGEEGLVDVRIIRALYDSLEGGGFIEVEASRDRRSTPDMAKESPALHAPELVTAREPSG